MPFNERIKNMMAKANPSTRGMSQLSYDVSVSYEEHKELLMGLFQLPGNRESDIEAMVQKHFPGFRMEGSKEQRAERKALSERARELLVDMYLTDQRGVAEAHSTEDYGGEGMHLDRPYIVIMKHDAKRDANHKQFNLDFIDTFSKGPEAMGSFIFEEIERCRRQLGLDNKQDIHRLWNLSDQELVDKYPMINRLASIMGEYETMMSTKEISFTEKQKEQMLKFKDALMDLHLVLENRMNAIANPYYEMFDPQKMRSMDLSHLVMDLNDNMSRSMTEKDPHSCLQSYIGQTNSGNSQRSRETLARLTESNPHLVEASLGHRTGFEKNVAEAFQRFEPVVAHTREHGLQVLKASQPEQIVSAVEHMQGLKKAADEADKWLLTGSKEYADMQKQLNSFLDWCSENPNSRPEALQQRATRLAVAARTYLKHKGFTKDTGYDMAAVDAQGKNQREQSRMNVATEILSFAAGCVNSMSMVISREKQAEDPQAQQHLQQNGRQQGNQVEERARQAQDRLDSYVGGRLNLGTKMENGKAYRFRLMEDVQTLAFREAVKIGNRLSGGEGAYQQIINARGYDQAFKAFAKQVKDNEGYRKTGLTEVTDTKIDAFLKDDGPRKMALLAMKLDPSKVPVEQEGNQLQNVKQNQNEMNKSQASILA